MYYRMNYDGESSQIQRDQCVNVCVCERKGGGYGRIEKDVRIEVQCLNSSMTHHFQVDILFYSITH